MNIYIASPYININIIIKNTNKYNLYINKSKISKILNREKRSAHTTLIKGWLRESPTPLITHLNLIFLFVYKEYMHLASRVTLTSFNFADHV